MDTIERTSTAITVKLGGLLELLEGASTHAHKDSDLRALNAVKIEGDSESLTATATDRYRLITGKIEGEGNLPMSLVPLTDIKRVISLLKGEGKRADTLPVTLSRVADILSVSVRGNAISVTLLDANFPDSEHLFAQFDNPSPSDIGAIDTVSFNPALFADYSKIIGKSNGIKVTFIAKGKPMLIGLASNKVAWRALLMPMRIID